MRLESEVVPIKERSSFLFLRYGRLDVENGAFVLVDEKKTRMQIPVGGLVCLFLQPGTVITHAAVALAASCGTLLLWVGENGVTLYSAGRPGGHRSDKLLYQAKLALDEMSRLQVVRSMYRYRFGEDVPRCRSIEQLRGIEGARVKALYQMFADRYNIKWNRRNYDLDNWTNSDPINNAISVANHCLYGICEAAILIAGYSPAIGFIHTGTPRAFIYDIADLFKFETVIPLAFHEVSKKPQDVPRAVRLKCRDMFREKRLLKSIIPVIEEMLKIE